MESKIRVICEEVRKFLEERWPSIRESNGIALPKDAAVSHNMCMLSSFFLENILSEEIPRVEWCVFAGTTCIGDDVDPQIRLPGGYKDEKEKWWPHHWVGDNDGEWIVNITADQFGSETVIVTTESPSHKENYFESFVEEDRRNTHWRVSRWLEEWHQSHAPGWIANHTEAPGNKY